MQTENEEVLVTNIVDARSDKPRPRSPAPNFWIGPSRRHVRTYRDELLVRSGESDPQPLPGAERERPDAIAPSHRPGIGVGRNVVLPDPVRRPQARGPVPESRVGGGEEGPDGLRPRILPRRVVLERALVRLLRIARPRLLRHLLQGAGKSDVPQGVSVAATLVEHADDVTAFCASLETPAVLVGHSFGGLVAQQVMCRRKSARSRRAR